MSRARDALGEKKGVLLLDSGADCGGDVAEVVVGHPRSIRGEAEAGAEEEASLTPLVYAGAAA